LGLDKGGDGIIARFAYDEDINEHVIARLDLHVGGFGHLLTVNRDDVELIFALHDETEDDLGTLQQCWLRVYGNE
jgi:hypothetical protein